VHTSTTVTLIVAALSAVGGGGLVALIRVPGLVGKDRADAAAVNVETALTLMGSLREEFGNVKAEIEELRREYKRCHEERDELRQRLVRVELTLDQHTRKESGE